MLASPDALIDGAHRENPGPRRPGRHRRRCCGGTSTSLSARGHAGRPRRARARVLACAGSAGRRIVLDDLGRLAALLCLLGVVGAALVLLVPLAACAATVALLLRPESHGLVPGPPPGLTRRSGGEVRLGQPGRAVLDHLAASCRTPSAPGAGRPASAGRRRRPGSGSRPRRPARAARGRTPSRPPSRGRGRRWWRSRCPAGRTTSSPSSRQPGAEQVAPLLEVGGERRAGSPARRRARARRPAGAATPEVKVSHCLAASTAPTSSAGPVAQPTFQPVNE